MRQNDAINRAILNHIIANDKKPGAIADKAGVSRSIFSRIIHSRRPIYADELVPILNAAGMTLEEALAAMGTEEKGA